jgi:hypothetical protein
VEVKHEHDRTQSSILRALEHLEFAYKAHQSDRPYYYASAIVYALIAIAEAITESDRDR